MEEKLYIFVGIVQNKQKALHADPESVNQSVIMEQHEFQNPDESILQTFQVHQEANAQKKTICFYSNMPIKLENLGMRP